MYLHSKTIYAFKERVEKQLKQIIDHEVQGKLPVTFKRNLLYIHNHWYRLNITIFENKTQLGFFSSNSLTIGISKRLIYEANDSVCLNILRHELAHFLVYVFKGDQLGHRMEFRSLCESLGWGSEVYLATTNIEEQNLNNNESVADKKMNQLLEKIKKLLALSSSSNVYESEMATSKANQLLLQHNLDLSKNLNFDSFQKENEDEFCSLKVLNYKKSNAKQTSISQILKTFYVKCVTTFSDGEEKGTSIEIIGDKTSVLLAEYVAFFLDHEFDRLWLEFKKKNQNQKGVAVKNSFFRGIAKGYIDKITQEKNIHLKGNELSILNSRLENQLNFVYPRLGYGSTSRYIHVESAHSAGKETGKNLSIKKAVGSSSSEIYLLR